MPQEYWHIVVGNSIMVNLELGVPGFHIKCMYITVLCLHLILASYSYTLLKADMEICDLHTQYACTTPYKTEYMQGILITENSRTVVKSNKPQRI